jgi:transposase
MADDVRRLQEENDALRARIHLLEQKIDLLVRQIYGPKSEKLDPDQLQLLLDPDESKKDDAPAATDIEQLLAGAEPDKGKHRARAEAKPRIPDNLPVVEEVIDPPAVSACPQAWRQIGEERSELLDYEPGRFFCRRIVRRKYVSIADKEAAPVIAELPPKLIEGGKVAPGLLAHIVISKYADHLPLYRQQQIYNTRNNVWLPRQTQARWILAAAEWLQPIQRQMRLEIFARAYVQVDETPIKYLCPGNGRTKQGYLWAYHVPGGDTVFDWGPGRGTDCLRRTVPDSFEGILQCDAYQAYKSFARERSAIELAGCMAHARRRFYEAREEAPQPAAWLLRQFSHLYRIEAQLREARAGPVLRQSIRQSESKMILTRIQRALFRLKANRRYLPQSLFGKALSYCLDQWKLLNVFVSDGLVEIDNNLAENAIRPTAVGKKNWLFIGDVEAGWRSAVIYSIIASCRTHGIEPFAYLREMFSILPRATNHQIPQLTPRAWAERQRVLQPAVA